MWRHRQPILTLLLLTPILTELLSGNIPPARFFQPLTFLFLATVAYGFPVLLLREFACRHKMGLPGTFCLGLVYGIINEGILAKTFYRSDGLPIALFNHYGNLAGIAMPWALTISVCHAFHSVGYPILVVYWLFPGHRQDIWLPANLSLGLAVPTGLLLTLNFFGHSAARVPGQLPHYVLMALLCTGLLWCAVKLPRRPQLSAEGSRNRRPIIAGLSVFCLLFFIPLLLAGIKFPTLLFYSYYLFLGAFGLWWLAGRSAVAMESAVLWMCGDEIIFIAMGLVISIGHGAYGTGVAQLLLMLGFVFLLSSPTRFPRSRSIRDATAYE